MSTMELILAGGDWLLAGYDTCTYPYEVAGLKVGKDKERQKPVAGGAMKRGTSLVDIFVAMATYVIMKGPPGSGKSIQCSKFAAEFGFSHLSVGDLHQAEIQSASQHGYSPISHHIASRFSPFP
ncbi:hypothetical protein L6164_036884 [Bauhinia variegata]|uniref:Uncharacterized protein n=1 Tax=Bauhinia variegata TaxID=167791 RepID=A0ACB9KII5_BAUVA|nr:hypothetical protein L6164_036884 [Bauhinia variegata]